MKYLQAVWVLGWLAFMSLVLVPRASAQAEWLVRGTVSDVSGATLGGARVEALRGARVVARTVTGQDGTYRLELTVLESHLIQIQMNGFVTGVAVVDAAEERISDFQLEIAPLNDFLVVTPSRTAESRVAVTESHSIITAEDIRASGSSSLADIIQQLPGMNVASTGRAGALTSLFARGGESDYNHVLIDGVRVNVSGGQFDFSRVSATEIEHVEVVRGAQSALYGSDAIGWLSRSSADVDIRPSRLVSMGRLRPERSIQCGATYGYSVVRESGSTIRSVRRTAALRARLRTAWKIRIVSIIRPSMPASARFLGTLRGFAWLDVIAMPGDRRWGRSRTGRVTTEHGPTAKITRDTRL